jgi:hypothetical protein
VSGALFDVDAPPVDRDDMAGLSPNRRRTARQRDALQRGLHPLSLVLRVGHYLALHDEAAPADDPKAAGRRCGNCRFRRRVAHEAGTFPKCLFGAGAEGAPRVTHGAGTDVRAWWPACRDHEPGDPNLPDAMRWVPEPREMR